MPKPHPHRSRFHPLWILGLLVLGLGAGLLLTEGGDPSLAYNASAPLTTTPGLVDQTPLQTARNLSAQAATAPEVEFAQQALQVGDHEVDQAFAEALRRATEQQPPLSGKALQVARHIGLITQRIAQEQEALQHPAASSPDPTGTDKELAQAQLALDQDDLEDLQQDLIRMGGDRKAKIQQALDQHEAVQAMNAGRMHNEQAQAMESPDGLRTMQGKVRAWLALGERARMLATARADAQQAGASLSAQHDALEKRAEDAAGSATVPSQAGTNATAVVTDAGAVRLATLSAMHAMASQRTTLAELDKRIHDEQQLAEIYTRWRTLVVAQRRTVLHRILVVTCVVVVLLGMVLVADRLVRRFFERSANARQLQTMRIVVTVGIQAMGLGLILLALFGAPTQTPTILGIVTAGLTVVLKDFIVAFFGWFVLMGRNGVRVGDWVEINGVSGEVTELGIIRTTLLETGSWAESAHPTGRRVTFMNGYAIEGRYFNFSTAGQWLWDELKLTVPSGPQATAKIEAMRAAVEARTLEDAVQAEQDWQRATRQYGSATRAFSAAPIVELRPTGESIQVTLRYLTRAEERAQVRSELYERAIGILHAEESASGSVQAEVDASRDLQAR